MTASIRILETINWPKSISLQCTSAAIVSRLNESVEMEPRTGVEPVTYALRVRRSTNWAISAFKIRFDKWFRARGVKGNGLCGGSYLDGFQKILRLWGWWPTANDMIAALCFFIRIKHQATGWLRNNPTPKASTMDGMGHQDATSLIEFAAGWNSFSEISTPFY